MSIKNELARLRLGGALERESGDPTVKRVLADEKATREKGEQRVAVNVHLAKLRSFARDHLVEGETIKDLLDELETVRADATRPTPRYSDEGRAVREREIRAELQEAVVEGMREYNEIERAFVESFPDPGPPELPMSDDDVNRAMLLLRKLDGASPGEILTEFEAAVRRYDRVVVDALRGKAKRALESDEITKAPRETLERFTLFVELGDRIMRTGPDGRDRAARERAIELAPRIRSEVETVAETIVTDGSLDELQRMAAFEAVDPRDETGKPVERSGGAFPSLAPIFDDEGAE